MEYFYIAIDNKNADVFENSLTGNFHFRDIKIELLKVNKNLHEYKIYYSDLINLFTAATIYGIHLYKKQNKLSECSENKKKAAPAKKKSNIFTKQKEAKEFIKKHPEILFAEKKKVPAKKKTFKRKK
jgi:hypothetical protein